MQNLIFIAAFLFGLTVGSFLNCLIYRLETSVLRPLQAKERGSRFARSFLFGRSYCPNCRHILTWQELIPVLSFLILKGKCRYCQKPISFQYPLVELATGILFVLIFNFFALPSFSSQNLGGQDFNFLTLLYYLLISCFLIIIFVYDLKHYLIPDKVIYPAIGITFLYQLFRILNFGHWDLFRISDLGFGILPSLFFLAIILFSRGKWMGFGDFKLAILMGLFLGFPNILLALFLAFFIGAIIGMLLISIGKKTLKSEIPFGPFLVIGTFVALFLGQQLINWYLEFFL